MRTFSTHSSPLIDTSLLANPLIQLLIYRQIFQTCSIRDGLPTVEEFKFMHADVAALQAHIAIQLGRMGRRCPAFVPRLVPSADRFPVSPVQVGRSLVTRLVSKNLCALVRSSSDIKSRRQRRHPQSNVSSNESGGQPRTVTADRGTAKPASTTPSTSSTSDTSSFPANADPTRPGRPLDSDLRGAACL